MDNSENRNTVESTGRLSSTGVRSVSYTGRHETVKETPDQSQTGTHKAAENQDSPSQVPQRPSYTGRHQTVENADEIKSAKTSAKMPERNEYTGVSSAVKADRNADCAPYSGRRSKKNRYYLLAMVLAVICLIAASILLRSLNSKSEYLEYYNTALEKFTQEDYEAALTNLRAAADVDNTQECISLMADCYERMGSYDKAIETLRLLDTTDQSVRDKIASLQSQLDRLGNEGKITVCGNYYDPSTSELVLKGVGLDDTSLDEIVQLYALTSLNLSNNNLNNVSALASLGGLATLDLSGNAIRSLSGLESLTNLRVLYLDDNPITDFSTIYSLTNLATLSIKGIDVTADQLAALSSALPSCAIHSEEITLTAAELSIAGITFDSEVTELDLSGLAITDISSLSKCRYLTKLDLSGNDITDISSLMDLPNLKWLDISSNSISDLRPLMSLSALTYLDASDNSVSSAVVIGRLTLLKTLDLSNNPLTDISAIGKLQKLTSLNLQGTSLEDEMLMFLLDCKSLTQLNIKENPNLTGEAVQGFTAAMSECTVEHDDLVFSVAIGDNIYKDDITELDLQGMEITDLSPLLSFKNLERLNLKGNAISNIYNLEYVPTLKYLNLSDNLIEDITPVAMLTCLEELDLSNNAGISTITQFLGLTALTELNLTGTSISQENLDILTANMPWCHIIY